MERKIQMLVTFGTNLWYILSSEDNTLLCGWNIKEQNVVGRSRNAQHQPFVCPPHHDHHLCAQYCGVDYASIHSQASLPKYFKSFTAIMPPQVVHLVSWWFCCCFLRTERQSRRANVWCFIQWLYESYSLIYKEAKWQRSSPAAGPSWYNPWDSLEAAVGHASLCPELLPLTAFCIDDRQILTQDIGCRRQVTRCTQHSWLSAVYSTSQGRENHVNEIGTICVSVCIFRNGVKTFSQVFSLSFSHYAHIWCNTLKLNHSLFFDLYINYIWGAIMEEYRMKNILRTAHFWF